MAEMENNLALSLIRYCDVLPADRVFYEAGQVRAVLSHKLTVSVLISPRLPLSAEQVAHDTRIATSSRLYSLCVINNPVDLQCSASVNAKR
jgi:hypothetical protein